MTLTSSSSLSKCFCWLWVNACFSFCLFGGCYKTFLCQICSIQCKKTRIRGLTCLHSFVFVRAIKFFFSLSSSSHLVMIEWPNYIWHNWQMCSLITFPTSSILGAPSLQWNSLLSLWPFSPQGFKPSSYRGIWANWSRPREYGIVLMVQPLLNCGARK